MNIAVCVKQVLDPEMPTNKFWVKDNQVVPPEGIDLVLNPCDAQAVEAALRVKEKYGGKITAITVGPAESLEVVRRAVAMGADEGIVLSDDAFAGSDSLAIAYILARTLEKLDKIDLILCGREAADWSMGIVGPVLAERLNLPLITLAKEIELLDNNILKVERVIPDGTQVFEVSLPAVLTVSNEIGLPRLPTGMGIVSAIRKKIPVWTSQDINTDTALIGGDAVGLKLISLSIPDRERKCEFIKGDTPGEIADNLAAKLRAAGTL
jgi:electron transfer flavoprotein beta subunit